MEIIKEKQQNKLVKTLVESIEEISKLKQEEVDINFGKEMKFDQISTMFTSVDKMYHNKRRILSI